MYSIKDSRKKGIGRMVTYLKTISTTVSQNGENIFQRDCEISTTGILKIRQRVWFGNDSRVLRQLIGSWLNDTAFNWKVGRD